MNKSLFSSHARTAPVANTVNEAGGIAYQLPDEDALAMLVSTSCFNGAYYTTAEEQRDAILALVEKCSPDFVAKAAVYARECGRMKDAPALLVAWLYCKGHAEQFEKIASRVLDTGKQVANFVQIVQSGMLGRKGLGSRGKRFVQRWLADLTIGKSVGFGNPSIADLIRLGHPKPKDEEQKSLFGYLSGRNPKDKPFDVNRLPQAVRDYEAWKVSRGPLPQVPWQMLTTHDLKESEWRELASRMSWSALRQSLNTMLRQGALKGETVGMVANRIKDPVEIAKAKPYPYQVLTTYKYVSPEMPPLIVDALHDAMEQATKNAPCVPGGAAVFVDVSGSMSQPITGTRIGATSKMRCIDVAALVGATLARTSPGTRVIPFDTNAYDVRIEPRDSVMTNANFLAKFGGGGTNCALGLAAANHLGLTSKVCVYASDNESWIGSYGLATGTMEQWIAYKARVRDAVLVCINLQPSAAVQAAPRADILNIGGFSDDIFNLLASVAEGGLTATFWADKIKGIAL